MSFSHEMPAADHEAFMDFRQEMKALFKEQAEAVAIAQDPDNMILPTEYFLGGQLEIDPDLFGSVAVIRADVGTRQLTTITLETDEYMMTDDKVFDIVDPESPLNDDELDHLSWLLRNKRIKWSSDQSAIVAQEYKQARVSIFAKRDKYLGGSPEKMRPKLAEVSELVHSKATMSSVEIQPPDAEMSKIQEYLIYEAIKTDTNGLFQEYEPILEVVSGDDEAGTRTEIILGGLVPSSKEWPEDYIDITLIYSVINMHRITTVVAGGGQFEISDEGVVMLSDLPHHRLMGDDLVALSFLLKQRDPIAKYSRENTLRLAEAWRQSKQAPPVD
jgi:hypothetical protein